MKSLYADCCAPCRQMQLFPWRRDGRELLNLLFCHRTMVLSVDQVKEFMTTNPTN